MSILRTCAYCELPAVVTPARAHLHPPSKSGGPVDEPVDTQSAAAFVGELHPWAARLADQADDFSIGDLSLYAPKKC